MSVKFEGYTDEQKKIMQNVLMNSPLCWKDGQFKFDRSESGNKKAGCRGICYECMFENFNLST